MGGFTAIQSRRKDARRSQSAVGGNGKGGPAKSFDLGNGSEKPVGESGTNVPSRHAEVRPEVTNA